RITSRTGVDLLLQVLNLALQGVDVTRDLATEGVELRGTTATLRRSRAVILLAFDDDHVLLQALDGGARVTLFFHRGDVSAESFDFSVDFTRVGLAAFQGSQFAAQGFHLG